MSKSSTRDEDTSESSDVVAREEDGKFKKGVSGNPKGRPKGSKNAITLLRQSLELELRERAAPDVSAVLDKAIELALDGNTAMIKLLLDLHMTKGAPDEREAKERTIINVNAPTSPAEVTQIEKVDYEDISDA